MVRGLDFYLRSLWLLSKIMTWSHFCFKVITLVLSGEEVGVEQE